MFNLCWSQSPGLHVPLSSMASGSIWKNPLPSRSLSSTTTIKVPWRSNNVLAEASHSVPSHKKVLVPIGYGTEEMEAVVIVDVLRRAGAEVLVASVESEIEVEASGGTRLVADTSITGCCNEAFDLIAFPGGMPGAARLRDSDVLRQITVRHVEKNKLYGAISAAPAVTLLPWDLLRRKQMTGHPAFMDKLPSFWAVKSNVHVSGQLTTSRGPGTCFEFSLRLVEQLFGESVANQMRNFMLMDIDDTSSIVEFNEVKWLTRYGPRVLIPVADGLEGIEIVAIVDILKRAKVDVVIASVEDTLQILTSQSMKIVADKDIAQAAESSYDCIVLPGGSSGMEKLSKCEILIKLLDQHVEQKIYGGINTAPAILHGLGLLGDKKITAHPSVVGNIKNAESGVGVVIDGKVITGKGPSSVIDFSLAMVSKFFGNSRAASVAEGLVFDYHQK